MININQNKLIESISALILTILVIFLLPVAYYFVLGGLYGYTMLAASSLFLILLSNF